MLLKRTKSQPTTKNMSTQTKTESKSQKNNGAPASIVWFEIPVDNVERAKTFYGKLFGWKIERFPGPKPYWHIDTGGADATPDGGMMERQCPEHSFTNYMGVPSVEKAAAKVKKLGGKICMEKTAVGDGLLRCLSGHGEQYLCAVGAERKGEIVVLNRNARSS